MNCEPIAQVTSQSVITSVQKSIPYAQVIARNPNTVETVVDIINQSEKTTLENTDRLLVQEAAQTYKSVSPLSILKGQIEKYSYVEDDFTSSVTSSVLGWLVTSSGSGASQQSGSYGADGIQKAIGVQQLDTGTTSGGRTCLSRSAGQVQLGYAKYTQTWRVAIEDLSTPTDRFAVNIGFGDNTGAGEDHTDGVYFKYRDDINGGAWQCICSAVGNQTVVNTSVVANTQYSIFTIEINEDATEAKFYINGVLVATIASNIPVNQGDFTGEVLKIIKSVGTTLRAASADYYWRSIETTGGRQ